MKKLWILPIFATGALSGWMVRSRAEPNPNVAVVDSSPTKISRARSSSSAKSKEHDSKWATFGKRAKDLNYEEKEAVVRELLPKDRMAALASLASQAGLEGLDYSMKAMMNKILETWADDDFQGAWSAAQAENNPDLRKFMMSKLLMQLARKDPDRAFALHLEQVAIDPEFISPAPNIILDAKLKLGAEEYLRVLSQTKFGNGSGGSAAEFAENFDFQMVADDLVKLLKDSKQPSCFPTNFYTEWAKKNPEAVYAWWSGNTSPPFNDFADIVEGVENRAPGTSAAWIASKLQEPGAPREKIIGDLARSSVDLLATRTNSIMQELPDDKSRDAFLTDLLIPKGYIPDLTNHGFVLTNMSSAEARLNAFRCMKEKWINPNIDKINDAQFQAWGITRDQVRQILGK